MTPTTTLTRIREASPCESGYKKLVKSLGGAKKYGEDTPITIRQIVESNGLDDALWCLCTMPEHNARWRLLAVQYARRTQRLMTDPISAEAVDVAERHARGMAADEELASAWVTAFNTSYTAADDDARTAARAASYAAQKSACSAARSVARFVRGATWGATWDVQNAEINWQTAELLRICEEETP